ncbi:autotransporter assembly complex protein TamA [Vibrio sp. ZSDE26]|uniref:Translocation and assembly module subunit TamA n=1 Tax=Vibrio amylolyticus TaxID=2847292 RepID=A0A9X2BJ44_9VIBR|nr:autotransporter assembly complex family protein [Vibrio amylolyticus]MCK6263092.1 autotransporter assembly complex protein TamA [Vibrio amylolyticus]
MLIKRFPVFILSLALSSLVRANDIEMSVVGLEDALQDNVDAYLLSIPETDYEVSLRFQSRLETNITKALNALGYYQPEFRFEIIEDKELIVHVSPGEPVIITKLDIVIMGEAQTDPDFLQLISRSGLKLNQPINHGQYDGLKSSIRNMALQKGYFKGDFSESRLEVVPSLNQAMIRLHYDSGMRYHFGSTEITGSQIREERVKSLQPYESGEPYHISKVGEYNQNLSNTDWFSSVFVEPDLSQLDNSRELQMKVALAPQARNQLETGIGFSTDVGARGTLKWKKPWVNDRGHSFDSSISLSLPEQSIVAGYKIPLDDVLHEYYRIQYGMKKVDSRDTKSLESNLSVGRHWLLDSGWHQTVRVRYLLENYEQGIQDDVGHFVLPGISFSRTRTKGGSMPMWGDRKTITLEYGDPSLLSETRLVRLVGGTSWIRGIGTNHRGLFRIDGGANFTQEFEKLSPSLLFFAGGDNNLRGYGYESISPKDETGALTGGKYMLTTSLEYQYRVTGNWWVATFYDYGDAFNESAEFKSGAGVGIRWGSPVGPIRLDFAKALDAEEGKDEYRIHFTLGPEL